MRDGTFATMPQKIMKRYAPGSDAGECVVLWSVAAGQRRRAVEPASASDGGGERLVEARGEDGRGGAAQLPRRLRGGDACVREDEEPKNQAVG